MHPQVTATAQHYGAQHRAREHEQTEALQQAAREKLAEAISKRGLAVYRHFHPELGTERTLWIDCRLDSRTADHQVVKAVLDQMGWRPDRERLSRLNDRYDISRMQHASTAATLVVIIKLPCGEVPQWEAA